MKPRFASVLALAFGVFGLVGEWAGGLTATAQAQVTFKVSVDPKAVPQPVSGRQEWLENHVNHQIWSTR